MTFVLVAVGKNIKNVVVKIRGKRMIVDLNRDWERELKGLKDRCIELGRSL
jgi:hypothetical protein